MPEGGSSIEVQSIKINNKYVNVSNYLSADSLINGASAVVDIPSANFIFDSSNPAASEFTTGATRTLTGGADSVRAYSVSTDEVYDALGGRDILYSGSGDDKISGGAGANNMFGGTGSDRFVFESAIAFDGLDRIEDFVFGDGDIIDVSDVLVGYVDGVSDVDDFVRFTTSGADTIMSIDVNGTAGGVNFQNAALIIGGAGLTPTALEAANLLDGVV